MSDVAHSATLPPWYCVRSQPSRQNVAAAHLRSFGVEVFNPHLRVRKATRAGVIWRTEPLFLNYVFARFDFAELHRRVRYAFGVSHLLHFGGRYAELSEAELAPVRAEWGPAETRPVDPALRPGDRVRLSGALFCGLEAEVLCLLPARQRVRVLIDLLGTPAPAEVAASEIVPVLDHPLATRALVPA